MARLRGLLLGSIVGLAACDGPTLPTVDSVAGAYRATTFTVEQGGVTEDILAKGGLINLTLNRDGTTAGRLFAPGGGEDGSDFDADLTGTWSLTGTLVTFQHEADTFVRDVPFTVSDDRLSAEATFSGVTLRVVLTKQ